jgi:hypothetical protein
MLRSVLKWTFRVVAIVVAAILVLVLAVLAKPLYHRWVAFPKEARAWEALAAQRQEVKVDDGWEEFRGVLHSHSEFSHDSEIPFDDILKAAHKADIDFIFMTDHCVAGKMDFSLQWRGFHEGVLFMPGFELSNGFLVWRLPQDAVVPCAMESEELAKRVEELGGVIFFCHTEEERPWHLSQVSGMEIYNIHTDFLDESYLRLMPDILVNLGKHPEQAMRLIYQEQTDIIANWDRINEVRKYVGIAASDSHQNVGIRGSMTEDGKLKLRETGPKTIGEYELNVITRLLLKAAFGPLEPGKQLFRFELDPYERSLRYVNTHLLAKDLSEDSLFDALLSGRAFVSFDMLADSSGFVFFAQDGERRAVMGEELPLSESVRLHAASPVPCQFRVWSYDKVVWQQEGRELLWSPMESGRYRVECWVEVQGEWVPWLYTNPLTITKG